ncbi:MAG TPA: hypothetical protein VJ997_09240 [Longimicrobiales bacterium]|nr:hypothetical protein [Longimicrobiales bacterium]
MRPKERGVRQVLGTCLSALIVTLSVAVPVLERADLARETAFESHHDPATCSPGHNHTLCTQVGASHALPSRQDLRVPVSPFVGGHLAGDLGAAFVPTLPGGHTTRAPPSA